MKLVLRHRFCAQRSVSGRGRRRAGALLVALLTAILALQIFPAQAAEAAVARPKPTVVSLTFDDSNADQMAAATVMRQYRVQGTFYTVPSVIDTPNFLTLNQLHELSAAGNEIGGHTVNHADLTMLPADEAARQVCLARNTLSGWGFTQQSFAYPYAAVNPSVETIARDCGYNSARSLGDLKSRFGCPDCAYAEPTPPADPYNLAALDQVDNTWTLTDLQNAVTNAETVGGWVILTFHHICAGPTCDPLSVSPSTFTNFVKWLAARKLARPATSVKTVGQVIGGTTRPPVTPPAPPTIAGALTNASYETAGPTNPDGPTSPACFTPYTWGTNNATFTTTTDAHTGTTAAELAISTYTNGAIGLYPTFDTGGCTPAATPGHTYTITTWYKSTTPVQFAAYLRNARGGFDYWTSSTYQPATTTWAQATWTTPTVPAGATGISSGLSLFSPGTLTTDDITYNDTATLPPQTPPTALANASLENPGINAMPQCWTPSSFGTNDATFTETTPGHTGNTAVTVTITNYTDGAAQLLPTMYGSSCAPQATPGHTYTLGTWYQSTTTTQFITYYQTSDGTWNYWTASPWLPPAPTWTNTTWTTPPLPANATRIAYGLSLFTPGTLTTDDYTYTDTTTP